MTRCTSWLLFSLLLTGCGVGEGTGSTPPWAQPATPVAAAAPADEAEDPSDVEQIPPYKVKLETSKGDVIIAVQPEWAPRGAIRFKELVEAGYYDDVRIYRVMPGFVAQFGMHGDPQINKQWQENRIQDDRVKVSNRRGSVTFATSGPNSRTAQIFINLADNAQLDTMAGSFAPFAEVVEGMDVVEAFNDEYAGAPGDKQPEIAREGNLYLDEAFPGLDSIIKATIIDDSPSDAAPSEDVTNDGKPAEPPTEEKPATVEPESEPATTETTPSADDPAPDEAAPSEEAPAEPASDETPNAKVESDPEPPADAQ